MDRSDFYYAQEVTEAEMDQAFDDCENADRNLEIDQETWGIHDGYEVTESATPDLYVNVANGVAYDEDGQRIPHTAGPTAIDLSSYIPGTPGQSVYVRLYAEFDRDLSDPRTDGYEDPIDYRQTETVDFYVQSGTPAASPTKPSILADKVLLATIILDYGQTAILDADISMEWFDLAGSAIDRQMGGVILRGKKLNGDHRIAYSSIIGTVIKLGGSNILDFDSASLNGSYVHATQRVGSYGINTASKQGHVYIEQTSPYDLLEIEKWLNYDACHFLPGENNDQHPWQGASTPQNCWYLDEVSAGALSGGAVPSWYALIHAWRCEVYDGYSRALIWPLTGLPHECKLTSIRLEIEVLASMGTNYSLYMGAIRRRGDDNDLLTPDPPTQFQQTTPGLYVLVEDLDSGGFVIDNENEEYYVLITLHAAIATGFDQLRICGGRAKYLIREASHVY